MFPSEKGLGKGHSARLARCVCAPPAEGGKGPFLRLFTGMATYFLQFSAGARTIQTAKRILSDFVILGSQFDHVSLGSESSS